MTFDLDSVPSSMPSIEFTLSNSEEATTMDLGHDVSFLLRLVIGFNNEMKAIAIQ